MADLVRISILGSMPGGEKWSINPVFKNAAPLAISSAEATAMAVAVAGTPVPNQLLLMNPASVAVIGARVEGRNVDGTLEAVGEATRSSAALGTSAVAHPYQTSIVCSLRTTDSSAHGKGRLYWPACGSNISATTLRLNPTQIGDFLTGMNQYLADIRTGVRGVGGWTTASLAVWSRTALKTTTVISLRAGDVADVQRRRRDALVETYTSQVITPPA